MTEEVPKKKKKKNYLNNADMLKEIDRCHAEDKLTDEMANMFMSLVKRYATIPRFSGYSYNDDMQSLALLTLVEMWRKFDREKFNNPFAYYTQIVHNAFHQLDNKERRQRDIRDAVLVDHGKNPSFNYEERYRNTLSESEDLGDNDAMEYHDYDDNIDDKEVITEIMGEILMAEDSVKAKEEKEREEQEAKEKLETEE